MAPLHDAEWLFDRFTQTYLEDWKLESLRREWKYLHAELDASWPRREMRTRVIPASQLAETITDRLLRAQDEDPMHATRDSLTNQLVSPALEFLEEGRRAEAVVLFDAALRHDDDDAAAYNNLAFCLIPDEPENAILLLDRAIELGGPTSLMFKANRILALAYAGRVTSALTSAEDVLTADRTANKRGACKMWSASELLTSGATNIIECNDLYEYVQSIVAVFDRKV